MERSIGQVPDQLSNQHCIFGGLRLQANQVSFKVATKFLVKLKPELHPEDKQPWLSGPTIGIFRHRRLII